VNNISLLEGLGESAKTAATLGGLEQRFTIDEFEAMCVELEEFLLQEKVSVLALHADNGPSWVVADVVSQRMQFCLAPLPTFFSHLQIQSILGQCGASHLLTDNPDSLGDMVTRRIGAPLIGGLQLCEVKPHAAQTCERPKGTGKITFTSGSTGEAKGVCLSNEQLFLQAKALADVVNIKNPRHLCVLPLSTLLENVAGVYAPLLAGGQVIMPSLAQLGYEGSRLAAPEKMLAVIQQIQPETMILIPELLKLLVVSAKQGWPVPESFKFIAVGGSRVGQGLLQEAWSLGLPVYEGYGLSECASVVSLNTVSERKNGSCGKPLPHLQLDIRADEVVVKGNTMLGYLNRPESWYQGSMATGDLGYLDDEGYLHLAGRKKNLIISSYGRNISPEWPESELLANPLMQDAVVFGDAKPYCVALVSVRDSRMDNMSIQQWIDRVNQGLPDYAQIRGWHRLDQPLVTLPGMLTSNGRPRRAAIASHFGEQIRALYPGNSDSPLAFAS